MVLQLSRCKGDGVEIFILVDLGEDGPESARCVCRSCGRICDENILTVGLGESHHWLGGELFLQGIESLKGRFQKRSRFVTLVLACELEVWSCN